jgi:hypothetical protein
VGTSSRWTAGVFERIPLDSEWTASFSVERRNEVERATDRDDKTAHRFPMTTAVAGWTTSLSEHRIVLPLWLADHIV